jgi:hypothetical protein
MGPVLTGFTDHWDLTTFSWQSVNGTHRYVLQVSRDSVDTAAGSMLVNQPLPAGVTSFTIGQSLLPGTKYYWRIYAHNSFGYSYAQSPQYWFVTQSVEGVGPGLGSTRQTGLKEGYPNPFNPTTTMSFEIRESGFVSLRIDDVLGREITPLVNEKKEPGTYSVEWNARSCPSGIYYCRMQAGIFTQTRKLLLVR